MSWVNDKERLQKLARSFDKSVILTTKDGTFWKILAWALFIFTFGALKREKFIDTFAVTIGSVQAYPKTWSVEAVERTIPHESRHTKQARWFGLFIHPFLGLPLMFLFYVLLPLPLGLAYFRYIMELDADEKSWEYLLSIGVSPDEIRDHAKWRAQSLSSSSYGWAWPKSWAEKDYTISSEEHIIRNTVMKSKESK